MRWEGLFEKQEIRELGEWAGQEALGSAMETLVPGHPGSGAMGAGVRDGSSPSVASLPGAGPRGQCCDRLPLGMHQAGPAEAREVC